MTMELTGDTVMKIKHHTAQDQIFSFPDGFIGDDATSFEVEVQPTKIPVAGPMSNIGNDFSGIGKTITVNGVLYDQSSSVVTNNNITTKEQMKYWLESLTNGFQIRPCEINTPLNEYSLRSNSNETPILGVNIPGDWVKTKGYVTGISFSKVIGDVEQISFSLTIWVAGQ